MYVIEIYIEENEEEVIEWLQKRKKVKKIPT